MVRELAGQHVCKDVNLNLCRRYACSQGYPGGNDFELACVSGLPPSRCRAPSMESHDLFFPTVSNQDCISRLNL